MVQPTRRDFLKTGALCGGSVLAGVGAFPSLGADSNRGKPLNVLFIAVDDLRPQLRCYGVPGMHTPNIDRLASQGALFTRAYCQQAVCSPSRTSLLLGKRPDTTRVYDLQTHFRDLHPDAVTLPQHFKSHGYTTRAFGKIFHGGLEDPPSWSEPSFQQKSARFYANPETKAEVDRLWEVEKARGGNPDRKRGPSWESFDAPDEIYPDAESVDLALDALQELRDQPFFLAVGFYKPHLPFVVPKKYYDLYPLDSIRLPDHPYPPKGAPEIALTSFGELRAYSDIPQEGPLSEQQSRELIRAYYAATSFVDAQIGRLLDELERLGLSDETVVVLWGDHGWQLLDHGLWCKHTNFEAAVRSPLILKTPGRPSVQTDALVEFVDIYPTLCDLCDLPLPPGLEGVSLASLIEHPDLPWKTAAFSQYPRGKDVMGYSIRTDRHRYTEWRNAKTGTVERELYDHESDAGETVNLAASESQKPLVDQLAKQLEKGWREAVPPRIHLSGTPD